MNPGAAAFFIFLFIVGAFSGLGYLVPEMNRQAVEIQDLQAQKIALEADLVRLQQTIQAQQSALEKAHARILELERFSETEQAAKQEALTQLVQVQEAYNNLQQQLSTLQEEIRHSRANPTLNAPKMPSIRADYKPILPWVPPVLFLAFAGGYGFHRVKISKTFNTIRIPEVETMSFSENVTVLVPRKRVPEFVKWLRSQ
jgi:hypothetical protein